MPGKQYKIMYFFLIFLKRINFSYLGSSSLVATYFTKMPHEQGTLGVNRNIYIKLSIKPKVQGDEVIWSILSCLPKPIGKLTACERLHKQ